MFVVLQSDRGGRRAARDLLRRSIPRERPEGVQVPRRRRCRRSARRTWVCSAEAPSNRFALLGVSCNNNVHYLLYSDTYYAVLLLLLYSADAESARVAEECICFSYATMYLNNINNMPNVKHSDAQ